MLRLRLIFGSIVVSLLVALCWLDSTTARPGVFLAPLALLFCGLATSELLAMLRTSGSKPIPGTTVLGALLPVAASCTPLAWDEYPEDCPVGRLGWLACGLAAGLVLALVSEFVRRRDPDASAGAVLSNLSGAALALLYLGGLISFLVQLRITPFAADQAASMLPFASTVLIVKFSDTCQYFVGRKFGRNKLAPIVSPGKTWEGAIGGIGLCVLILATVLATFDSFPQGIGGWLRVALYCLLLCVAGIVGDLLESMLKRDAGVKDSSSWLPGLGGVMDMLDSLLLAAPVSYACWLAGLLSP